MLPTSPDPSQGQNPADSTAASDVKSVLIPESQLPELSAQSAGIHPEVAVPPGAEDVEARGADAEAIRLAVERGHVVAGWLQALEPQEAPFALAGRVVAAMNPGHQQERSVAALARLEPLKAPSGLEQRVAAHVLRTDPQMREIAPAELDRLVEERVVEPEATMVRGMTLRLGPVPAPSELESRVERQVVGAEADRAAAPSGRNRGRMASAAFALAAGVLLSFWIAEPGTIPESSAGNALGGSGEIATAASGVTFRVVRVTDESMTDAERAVIRALGLPIRGEG